MWGLTLDLDDSDEKISADVKTKDAIGSVIIRKSPRGLGNYILKK